MRNDFECSYYRNINFYHFGPNRPDVLKPPSERFQYRYHYGDKLDALSLSGQSITCAILYPQQCFSGRANWASKNNIIILDSLDVLMILLKVLPQLWLAAMAFSPGNTRGNVVAWRDLVPKGDESAIVSRSKIFYGNGKPRLTFLYVFFVFSNIIDVFFYVNAW
jgi:hypothetical protein